MERIERQEAGDDKDGIGGHHRDDHLGKDRVVDILERLYHADDRSSDHIEREDGKDDHRRHVLPYGSAKALRQKGMIQAPEAELTPAACYPY